jgi:hypothetical protein
MGRRSADDGNAYAGLRQRQRWLTEPGARPGLLESALALLAPVTGGLSGEIRGAIAGRGRSRASSVFTPAQLLVLSLRNMFLAHVPLARAAQAGADLSAAREQFVRGSLYSLRAGADSAHTHSFLEQFAASLDEQATPTARNKPHSGALVRSMRMRHGFDEAMRTLGYPVTRLVGSRQRVEEGGEYEGAPTRVTYQDGRDDSELGADDQIDLMRATWADPRGDSVLYIPYAGDKDTALYGIQVPRADLPPELRDPPAVAFRWSPRQIADAAGAEGALASVP